MLYRNRKTGLEGWCGTVEDWLVQTAQLVPHGSLYVEDDDVVLAFVQERCRGI